MNAQQFLRQCAIDHDVLSHQPTYSAQRMAQTLHVSGDEVAKTVLLRVEGEYVLVALQASHTLDLVKVKTFLNAQTVELASEAEFAELFPDCETGAVPPFGSQYGIRTLLDESLAQDERFVFEGNTHRESIRMRCDDYEKVERPLIGSFSRHT